MDYSPEDELRIAALEIFIATSRPDYFSDDAEYDFDRIEKIEALLFAQSMLTDNLKTDIDQVKRSLWHFNLGLMFRQ